VCGRVRHSFYDDIISVENLLEAWREFLKGKRRKKDVEKFGIHLMDNILELYENLKNKKYKHGGYHAFKINDPRPRDIHKATVRDRLLHHAIYRVLYPYFDKKFIFDSYSCRNERGQHRAMDRLRDFGRKVAKNHMRTVWVLKCDIRKFFASVDHGILLGILRGHVDDETFNLLREVIGSFEIKEKKSVGLPLGNLTSQLLVNVYMNAFDHFIKRKLKMKHYIRFADDFVFLHERRERLEAILPKIERFLDMRLHLHLHPKKVSLTTMDHGVDFLGWVHSPHHRVLRTATKRRMMERMKGKMRESMVASYVGMLGYGNGWKLGEYVGKSADSASSNSTLLKSRKMQ